jgi:hypothetical protein
MLDTYYISTICHRCRPVTVQYMGASGPNVDGLPQSAGPFGATVQHAAVLESNQAGPVRKSEIHNACLVLQCTHTLPELFAMLGARKLLQLISESVRFLTFLGFVNTAET